MKAFKIKNGLQASRYLLSSTTISGSTIDLSLGSMFSTTLSSDPAYTFTNPPASGVAQAFSLEVAGGTTTFTNDAFSTDLYTGNGDPNYSNTKTITNGIDLDGEGGLVWIKKRTSGGSGVASHFLFDTVRGSVDPWNYLKTDSTAAENADSNTLTSFNSNGFSLAYKWWVNENNQDYVSWTFKKKAKFFDMVTYSGNSTMGRTVSHSFGSTPGLVIIKSTTRSDGWYVIHKDSELLVLNNTQGNYPASTTADYFGDGTYTVRPTSTTITVGQDSGINGTGEDFIAYIFGHDTADDSLIKCGSYTKTGSSQDIDLGWSPEWLMLKRVSSNSSNWYIMDTQRGFTTDANPVTLNPNLVDAEGGLGNVRRTSTGFNVTSNAGEEWIYVAIRATVATDSAITWPTSIKWPAGVAPTTPVPGKKDLFTFLTTDGGTTYYGKKAAEGIA